MQVFLTHAVSFLLLSAAIAAGGCSARPASSAPAQPTASAPKVHASGAKIDIAPESPADTVRAFYRHLREDRFRHALFLTNLRPAIEGLTDSELRELNLDFAAIGRLIPHEVEINGEISSGDRATVTANLPDNESGKLKLQEFRLKRQDGYWVILTVDEEAEKAVRADGGRYFFNLKIATHHNEAKSMLNRVFRAQMVYAAQNDGRYGGTDELIGAGFLPDDIRGPASTGYNFRLVLADDRRSYLVAAEPAEYGKTGTLSFLVELDETGNPSVKQRENGGKSLLN